LQHIVINQTYLRRCLLISLLKDDIKTGTGFITVNIFIIIFSLDKYLDVWYTIIKERYSIKKEIFMKHTPINTAKQDPLLTLLGAMAEGPSNYIENTEKRGQGEFVGSDTLPTNFNHCKNGKEIMESWGGVKFGSVIENDPMFQYVELPDGWKKVSTDHSMWSKLLDDKGRERASIFYKAAFYDREAFIDLSCRYIYSFDYDKRNIEKICVANVTDAGSVIHTTAPITDIAGKDEWNITDEARNLAKAWLEEKYPDYRNPAAYWDN